MKSFHRSFVLLLLAVVPGIAMAEMGTPLPATQPLTKEGDLAMHMLDGMHTYLDELLQERVAQRTAHWQELFQGDNVDARLDEKRDQLRSILGAVDKRVPVRMETFSEPGQESAIPAEDTYTIYPVRWEVLPGVHGEGYLYEPTGEVVGSIVALPDADEHPELYFLHTLPVGRSGHKNLAAAGYRVLVMDLINRDSTWSGHPKVRITPQTHREFIYRGAYEMGRHIIGYEILKVESALDWLTQKAPDKSLNLWGNGEGGMLALYTAALDTRVDTTMVSGHFGPRENLWKEPIYRNVWSLLNTFGDAEVASMIAPRTLIVDKHYVRAVETPPYSNEKYYGAAPGQLQVPSDKQINDLLQQAFSYTKPITDKEWAVTGSIYPNSEQLKNQLGIEPITEPSIRANISKSEDPYARTKRQVQELLDWTQHIMEASPFVREELWKQADATSVDTWVESTKPLRKYFHEDIIGALPESDVPLNPRTRKVYETDTFTGYEVLLDVNDHVDAYGILLLPNDLKADEQRPVVVCQHGLEGRPQDIADPDINNHYYEQYGCKLAEEGFIVYAPQNPYIHYDRFRTIQRKANPLGLSLFSFIVAQHQATLNWLKTLPYVDDERLAFYGLSYGGKTAMRVPAILEDYCLSICSGDFNEWIWKNVSYRHKYSYVFYGEYEMFEWNLGNTLNYAEMSGLICPRPFMVERGHGDGVAPTNGSPMNTPRPADATICSDWKTKPGSNTLMVPTKFMAWAPSNF